MTTVGTTNIVRVARQLCTMSTTHLSTTERSGPSSQPILHENLVAGGGVVMAPGLAAPVEMRSFAILLTPRLRPFTRSLSLSSFFTH